MSGGSSDDAVAIPRVSIGLPVRNGEPHIAAALDSLLGQSFANFELLVSDNASTDNTAAAIAPFLDDPRVFYQRLPADIGAIANFNAVLARARAPYFMWAAHDDLWWPNYLAVLVAALDANPAAVLAYSDVALIDPDNHAMTAYGDLPGLAAVPYPRQAHEYAASLDGYRGKANLIYALMRRDVLVQAGGFSTWGTSNFATDILAVLRLLTFGPAVYAPGSLFQKRLTSPVDDGNVEAFGIAVHKIIGAAPRIASPPPAAFSPWFARAQAYEAESGIAWLRSRPSPAPLLRAEFFGADAVLWDRFAAYTAARTVVEVGCGPAPMVGQFPATATRIAVDPLLTQYAAAGAALDGIDVLLPLPAETVLPEIAPVDGAIICRNTIDHADDPVALLDAMLAALAPGAFFVFWATLQHDGADQGHRQITTDQAAFRARIAAACEIIRDVEIPTATPPLAYGCVAIRR